MNYKKRLGLLFAGLFILFSVLLIWVQLQREKEHTKEIYRLQFVMVSDLVAAYMDYIPADSVEIFLARAETLDALVSSVRIRILDPTGEYRIGDTGQHGVMSDYSEEPEVQNALIRGVGSGIRKPFGSDEYHFYYARQYGDFVIWMDMPFHYSNTLFTSDNWYAYFILLLFFVVLWVVMMHADTLRKNMVQMCDFLDSAGSANVDYDHFEFSNTELGMLGRRIVRNYRQLQASKDEINLLQEKLVRHFHYVQEGICIFSAQRKSIYANARFVQYVSNILEEPTFDMGKIFMSSDFKDMVTFLDDNSPVQINDNQMPSYTARLEKNGRTYNLRLLLFNDNSFEVSLDDVTRLEQNKTLKQEMTNNIAHELKTPVSSVRGYIETLLSNDRIDDENRRFFLERAYNQTLRLTELIQDVSFLNKIEEASDLFQKEKLPVREIVEEVSNDLRLDMERQKIEFENAVEPGLAVYGNRTLLYALFRNLVENSLRYAGDGVRIHVEAYSQDEGMLHFDYYDTGCGVEEIHMSRLFDRFYRVGEGRTRKDGGSGLGLAIVKNAVQFHGGMISARRYKDHGLEFVFTLERYREE